MNRPSAKLDEDMLWNIYENLFGEPPEDNGEYREGESEYGTHTRDRLVAMIATARERLGRMLHGQEDL